MLTVQQIKAIAGAAGNAANMQSVIAGLARFGEKAGLNRPHRLAHYLAQLAHESGRFIYDREIWGPTPAQKRYEDRADLGHSAAISGEASTFRGRGPIQVTGRHNYRKFTAWARTIDPAAPDFEANPDALLTDPWEGLSPIWYWDSGNPDGKSLNRYADENNIEMITKRINGGLNGYADRIELYTRTALVMLGYQIKEKVIEHFQADAGLMVDDVAGPKTRDALHARLLVLKWPEPKLEPAPVVLAPPVLDQIDVAALRRHLESALALMPPQKKD